MVLLVSADAVIVAGAGAVPNLRSLPRFPVVKDSRTVAAYSFSKAIHESVLVSTRFDSDSDGRPDKVSVDLIRPREPATAGVKVPVIMIASPYNDQSKSGARSEVKKYDATGTITTLPTDLDIYYVPRGYAVAMVDLPGTSRSTGCMDTGGPVEIGGVVAVIDWLNGRGTATFRDGRRAVADWSTGKVGMTGVSWPGSTANGVAATGVEGLVTIVPIAAISSWYHHFVHDDGYGGGARPTAYQGDLDDRPRGVCDRAEARQLADAEGDGDRRRSYWAPRDYRAKASRVRASVFAVHGLADSNVVPSQTTRWWSALVKAKVPAKLWLSRAGHADPYDYRRSEWRDVLHRWFDYWLYGIPNGIMDEPPVSYERSFGHWVEQRTIDNLDPVKVMNLRSS